MANGSRPQGADAPVDPVARAARVRERARALGFDAVGIARADVPLDQDFARYEAFLAAGMHGEMTWLAEERDVRRRLDGEAILRGARSVVCLARRYPRDGNGDADPLVRSVARYARGQDYHVFLRKKLRRLAAFLRTLGSGGEEVGARPLLDVAPVLERAWAARAGLGFVGKNGLLIVPGRGSYVLLGEVVTTAVLEPDAPIPERCGACTRCLEACPTGALVRPFVLDARRCVAYLTIEQRGPTDPALYAGIGEHLFGCDACQTVCPFNAGNVGSTTGARSSGSPDASPPRDPFAARAAWGAVSLRELLDADEPAWARFAEGSPVHRATRDGMARNAAVVLGNRARAGERPTPEELAALGRVAEDVSRSPAAREAARWALAQVEGHAGPSPC